MGWTIAAGLTLIALLVLIAPLRQLDHHPQTGEAKPQGATKRLLLAFLFFSLVLGPSSYGLYALVGSPQMLLSTNSAKVAPNDRDEGAAALKKLVIKVEAQLKARPDELKGWQAIGPAYLKLKAYDKAVKAYQNIVRLAPESLDGRLRLAEALYHKHDQQITPQQIQLYRDILRLDANNIEAAIFMIDIDTQQNRLKEAKTRLERLKKQLGNNSPFEALLSKQANRIQSLEAMDGALTPDTQAMIMDMVTRLDARLISSPNSGTLEDWQRLVRAYWVLGNKKAALDRLRKGLTALASSETNRAALIDFAKNIGIYL